MRFLPTGLFSRSAPGNVRAVAKLALPLVLSALALTLNEFADRVYLGKLSEAALAAALPASMLACTFSTFFACTIGFAGTFVAQFSGAGDDRRAVDALIQGLWLALFSMPLFLLFLPVGFAVLGLSGHAADLLAGERTYFVFYIPIGALSVFSAVLGGYLSGLGKTGTVGFATAVGCALNLVLDPVFIFVCDMGLAGSGFASLLAALATDLVLLGAIVREPTFRRARMRGWLVFRTSAALRILRFGWPYGVSSLVASATFTLFLMAYGRTGVTPLAAGNACFAVHGIAYNLFAAIGGAALIAAGRSSGNRDHAAVTRSLFSAGALALAALLLLFVPLFAFDRSLFATLFAAQAGADGEFVGLCCAILPILFVREILEAIQHILDCALRGTGDTHYTLVARTLATLFAWLPLTLLAAGLSAPMAFWYIMPVGFAAHLTLLAYRWKGGKWRDKALSGKIYSGSGNDSPGT